MNLQVSNYNFNFSSNRKLVPLSEYKGIILKLTKSDKATISKLESKIAELELEIHSLEKIDNKIKIACGKKLYYENRLNQLEIWIKFLREKIRNIKIARLKKQKIKALEK